MGIWRFAGAFAVVKRQSECGSKYCRNARQPADDHSVLAAVFSFCQNGNSVFSGTGLIPPSFLPRYDEIAAVTSTTNSASK